MSTDDAPDRDESPADPPPLDEQEWTLGDLRSDVLEFEGMEFRIEEPDSDEAVAALISPSADAGVLFRRVIDLLFPDLTQADVEERMTAPERARLANQALDWFGVDELIDAEAAETTETASDRRTETADAEGSDAP